MRVSWCSPIGRLVYDLFSPFRGLFFTAPVLLAGVYGLVSCFITNSGTGVRKSGCLYSSWGCICGLMPVFGLGMEAGLRYLLSWAGYAFLAVPIVLGFIRFPKITSALTIASVIINLLFTAVDPQVPTDFDAAQNAPTWPQWRYAPLFDYTLPMFLTGHAVLVFGTADGEGKT